MTNKACSSFFVSTEPAGAVAIRRPRYSSPTKQRINARHKLGPPHSEATHPHIFLEDTAASST